MAQASFTRDDVGQLVEHGLTEAEAKRQLDLLRNPPEHPRLERACTVGDGIEAVPEDRHEPLALLAREAAAAGRVQAFVPASGVASRMFQDFIACRNEGGPISRTWLDEAAANRKKEAQALERFLEHLDGFAFYEALKARVEAPGRPLAAIVKDGPLRPLVDALLEFPGMGHAHLPKGLLLFHRTKDGPRTAFEEHLVEDAKLMREERGACRLHFTVSTEHREEFAVALAAARGRFEAALGVNYEVSFSEQSPATDTLALDESGQPFRDQEGGLLFRPAGHGALIENLNALGADLAFIKNIDNIAHDDWKDPTWLWTRVLIGRLVEVEREGFAWLDRLKDGGDRAVNEAIGFCETAFFAHPSDGLGLEERRAWARNRLDRPIRVCGMVPNTGEPGGGPFWVRGKKGAGSIQIVEGAQVDPESPEQQQLYRRSTHFNPTFLAVSLRRRDGTPHDLLRFVDQDAVILAKKSSGGRQLLALERPGLWNGAMADWNTLLVEVPLQVFNPVKNVNDLLRPEHQPKGIPPA